MKFHALICTNILFTIMLIVSVAIFILCWPVKLFYRININDMTRVMILTESYHQFGIIIHRFFYGVPYL